MADPKHDDGARLDLGDEEQWVLHAALLHYLDRHADGATTSTGVDADPSPAPAPDSSSASDDDGTASDDGTTGDDETAPDEETAANEETADAIELLETLENEEALRLDREGLLLVRELLSEYLAGAPLRDRATCRSVLAEVRDEL